VRGLSLVVLVLASSRAEPAPTMDRSTNEILCGSGAGGELSAREEANPFTANTCLKTH
jgi:hypothetical protein